MTFLLFRRIRVERNALLLLAALLLTYLPSLSGGFLNYDDPWLIEKNPTLGATMGDAMRTIWWDLSHETRLVLGAEFLPVRDTSHWLEYELFGLEPGAMRLVNLLLFAIGVLFLRAALLRVCRLRLGAELVCALFALHPAHAESVAWLASRKDCLAFTFAAAGLWAYVTRRHWALLGACTVAAILSKSMACVLVPFLLAFDLLGGVRPARIHLLSATALTALLFALHLHVGNVVQMVAPAHATGLAGNLQLLGELVAGYIATALCPVNLSIIHDVAPPNHWTWRAALGLGVIAAWGVLAVREFRQRGASVLGAGWFCFFVGLLPVSQVLMPLQNVFADRYLLFALLGPAIVVGTSLARVATPLVWGIPAVLAVYSGFRGYLFADSARIFSDAHSKYPGSSTIAYQLGRAYVERGDVERAVPLYSSCARGLDDSARRCTLSLTKALAKRGELEKALAITIAARTKWPREETFEENEQRLRMRLGIEP